MIVPPVSVVEEILYADSSLIIGGTAFEIVSPPFSKDFLSNIFSVLELLNNDNSSTLMIIWSLLLPAEIALGVVKFN